MTFSTDFYRENRQYLPEYFGLYAILRSHSVQLQLSPFKPESFLAAIGAMKHVNSLMSELHVALLKVLIIDSRRNGFLGYWTDLDWSLLDAFTWCEYLTPILIIYLQYYKHEQLSKEGIVVNCNRRVDIEMITKSLKILASVTQSSYYTLKAYDKAHIIQTLVTIFIGIPDVCAHLEFRENVQRLVTADDQLPLFDKGDDGAVEVCILCENEGNIVCCDACPAGFHVKCLHENPAIFEGTWLCYECSIKDPMHSTARLKWWPVTEGGNKRTAIGYAAVVGIYFMYRESSGTDIKCLAPSQVHKLLHQYNEKDLHKSPWREYLEDISSWTEPEVVPVVEDMDISDEQLIENESTNKPVIKKSKRLAKDEQVSEVEVKAPKIFEPTKILGKIKEMNNLCDLEQVAVARPLLSPLSYINHYKKVDNMPLFKSIDSKLIQYFLRPINRSLSLPYLGSHVDDDDDSPDATLGKFWPVYSTGTDGRVMSIQYCLEAIYYSLGALVGDLWILHPAFWSKVSINKKGKATRLPWLLRLYSLENPSLKKLKRMTLELYNAINPNAFYPQWFLSESEICNRTLGGLGSIQLPTKPLGKTGFLARFKHFIKLKGKIGIETFSSLYRSGDCVASEDEEEEELASKSNGLRSNNSKDMTEEDGDDDDPSTPFKGNNKLRKTSQKSRSAEDLMWHKSFVQGSAKGKVSRKHLYRLGRNAGIGLLPYCGYKDKENTCAAVSFASMWYNRTSIAGSLEGLALQLRYLEQALRLKELRQPANAYYIKDQVNAAGMHTEFSRHEIIDLLTIVAATGGQINKVPSSIPIYQEYKAAAGPGTPPCYYSTLKLCFNKDDAASMGTELIDINLHEVPIKALQEYYSRLYGDYYIAASNEQDSVNELTSKYIQYAMTMMRESGTVTNNYQHIFVHKEILLAMETEMAQLKETMASLPIFFQSLRSDSRRSNLLDVYSNHLVSMISELARHHYAQLLHDGANAKSSTKSSIASKADAHRSPVAVTSTIASQKLFESYQLNVFKNKNGNKNANFLRPQEFVHKTVIDPATGGTLDRSFVSASSDIPNSYIPQVGDEIIYYASGHRDYLKYLPDFGSKKNRAGLVKKKGNNERIPCRILTIDYEFPSTLDSGIICMMQLGALGIPGLKQFFITYRPGHVLGEFLVPRNTLQSCLIRNWQKNNKFSMVYDDGTRYTGKIVKLEKDDEAFPIWSGAHVWWDEAKSADTLNEWELEPVEPLQKDDAMKLVASTEQLQQVINTKILHVVKQVMSNENFEVFLDAVTDDIAPSYSCIIPVTMHLGLCAQRASNNFYRQPVAFLGDIRTIYTNCVHYNQESNPITIKAAELYRQACSDLANSFPADDFSDYIQFDACLASKESVLSLMTKKRTAFL